MSGPAHCTATTDPFLAAPCPGARVPVHGAKLATPPPFLEGRILGTAKLTPVRAFVIYNCKENDDTALSVPRTQRAERNILNLTFMFCDFV